MQDMKRTPAEISKQMEPATAAAPKESYPYGLRITLDKEAMDKLGLKTPKVGDKFEIEALAVVQTVHESASADGPESGYKSVELQLTHLGLDEDDGEEEKDPAESLYGAAGTGAGAEK